MNQEEKREYWREHRRRSRMERSIQKATKEKIEDRKRKTKSDKLSTDIIGQSNDNLEVGFKVSIADAKTSDSSQTSQNRCSYLELASIARNGKLTYRNALKLGISKHIYYRSVCSLFSIELEIYCYKKDVIFTLINMYLEMQLWYSDTSILGSVRYHTRTNTIVL